MIRLLVRTTAFAGLAAFALYRFGTATRIMAWEVLIIAATVLMIKDMRLASGPGEVGLFASPPERSQERPRDLVALELAVTAAVSDSPWPDRRLPQLLRRIVTHRLARNGVEMGSAAALEMLGEESLAFIDEERAALGVDSLQNLVDRLERL